MANGEPRHGPFPLSPWAVFAVFVGALFLRVYHVGAARNFVDDANVHILTGLWYWKTGWLGPDAWWSPPLKHLLTGANSAIFGNDEVGWRIKGILFGSMSVVAAFLIARRAFRHELPAYSTAILFALDPFSISMAHTTHEDLPSILFCLLGLLFFLRGMEVKEGTGIDWFVSAAFFGAACALRWFALVPLIAAGLTAAWMRRDHLLDAAVTAFTFTFASWSVYCATYLPWLARGYSLFEWFSLQVDAFKVQGPSFRGLPESLLAYAGAGGWFVKWMGGVAGGSILHGSVSMLINDPVIWVFFVPSAALLCWVGLRHDRPEWVTLGGAFLGLYAFFLISPRPIILYSAMGVVPLGFVCLGFAIAYLFKNRGKYVVGALTAWSLFLFPVVGRGYIPPQLYGWVVNLVAR